jgi:hypothetical protein
MTTEFTFLGRVIQIVERENALHAKFTAFIDGVSTGVNWHLESSAIEDAKREIKRQDAEARRKAEPQWCMKPNDEAYAEAEERERFDLCS